MFDPVLVGPRTLMAAPSRAVWKTDSVGGTWRACWQQNFRSDIGEGAMGHAFMTLGLPGTSIYGRGEVWNNNFRLQEGAYFDVGNKTSYALRGQQIDIADLQQLYVTPPARLPMLAE